ncbi:unnamed protein product [Clavelina lepadiformis]|uniref:MI domain-containing protein n=1 Tax=Clavelina lepadiformis TaxID=159417 RepID=A0ABP0FAG1_CLALP
MKSKKSGGGGKGTWGKLGDEIEPHLALDNHDPNYDSEEQDADIMYKPVKPKWSREETEKTVIPILNEYFEHAQKMEAIDALSHLNIDDEKPMVVVCLITLAMEKKSEFRELASQLVKSFLDNSQAAENGNNSSSSNSSFMTENELERGFDSLRLCLADLKLDTPDAAEVLGKFIARAIFDGVLSRDIIKVFQTTQTTDEDLENKLSRSCALEADCLLKIRHNNLKYVWGVGGGIQPLEVLKQKMAALLKEYLSSGDSEEAMRCVRDLDVPHFHHEVVYEAIVMAIEVSTKRAISMLVHLLKRFSDTAIITTDQLVQGFVRVYSEMPDINLDVPNAYFFLEQLVDTCYELKVINLKLKVQAPSRSRKRFVSEGDGGRFKTFGDNYFDLV